MLLAPFSENREVDDELDTAIVFAAGERRVGIERNRRAEAL
jgi:hypothetical protein